MYDDVEILIGLSDPSEREPMMRALRRTAPDLGIWFTFDGACAIDLIFSTPQAEAIQKSLRLVLLDMALPKMNGLIVLRCLKANSGTGDTPVVLFSHGPGAGDETKYLEQGADGFLVMPEAKKDLPRLFAARLGRLLDRKTGVREGADLPLPPSLSLLSDPSRARSRAAGAG